MTSANKDSRTSRAARRTVSGNTGARATQASARKTDAKTAANKTTAAEKSTHKPTAARTTSRKSTATKTTSRKSTAAKTTSRKSTSAKTTSRKSTSAKTGEPVLLSGGNPQIAKGDGDAPVKAYIAAMPGWKREVGRRLDALVERTVPGVRKAVRWNSPFYGVAGQGWFLSLHCFTKYVKVVFLRGSALVPPPPVASKHPDTRYFHVHEHDEWDEDRLASWIRQASNLPGDPLF